MAGTPSPKRGPKAAAPQLFDQPLPASIDAEQSVLGGVLHEPQLLAEYGASLRPEHFFDAAHQAIFDAMRHVFVEQQAVDLVLLVDELKRRGQLEQVGGYAYLAKVSAIVPTAWHLDKYANIVVEKARLRAIIASATQAIADAYEPGAESRTILHQSETRLGDIAEAGTVASLVFAKDLLLDAIERLESPDAASSSKALKTGFEAYDEFTGGLHEAELIVLAGRPNMGKTSWALNVATNVAKDGGNVLFVSLEMARRELAGRLLSSEAKVNGHRLRNATIGSDDKAKLRGAYDRLAPSGLAFDDAPNRSILDVAAAARKVRRSRGSIDLVVIDYLGLLTPDDPKMPRQEQVARMTRQLKALARDLAVPILCLAQLNRQAESGRDGNRPKLSHLRESGAIEQDADVVLFVHREEYYLPPEKREAVAGQAEIIVAKNRNGPTGEVTLHWRKDVTRFETLAPARWDAIDVWNREADDGPVEYAEF